MADASIAYIARLAGVSNGIISHYFKDKNGLLEATMRHLMQALRDAVAERRLALGDDAPRAVAALFSAALDARFHPLLDPYVGFCRHAAPPRIGRARDTGKELSASSAEQFEKLARPVAPSSLRSGLDRRFKVGDGALAPAHRHIELRDPKIRFRNSRPRTVCDDFLEFHIPLPHSSSPVSNALLQLSCRLSHPTQGTAYARFTPSDSEQR